jgi:hypothetical protein
MTTTFIVSWMALAAALGLRPPPASEGAAGQKPVSIQDGCAPRIFASYLRKAQAKAAGNSIQWRVFKNRLDKQLWQVVQGGYQGSELAWISDFALGYQCLKDINPGAASQYADKAIAIMKSGMRDFQKGKWIALQFLAVTDGKSSTFQLPNSDIVNGTFSVYSAPVITATIVRGEKASTADEVSNYSEFLRVGDTPFGSDYVKGVDWRRQGNLPNNMLDWSLPGRKPTRGAKYYVSYASRADALEHKLTSCWLNGDELTFTSVPAADQALFVEYLYGASTKIPSSLGKVGGKVPPENPALAFQQTSAGDGGFNSIFIDANYPSRFLGKHIAMGLDWLDGYAGFSSTLKSEASEILVRWNDYLRLQGYGNYAASNYGAGTYISRAMTCLALEGRRSVSDGRILAEVLEYRRKNIVPAITNLHTSLKGGYWEEGYNYGPLAVQNTILAGLALEGAGKVEADPERTWAGEVIRYLIASQPTPTTTFDGGDWYAYPAPFPSGDKGLFYVAAEATRDAKAKAYANQIILKYPGDQAENYLDLLFRDPDASCSKWDSEPLHYFASGTNLLVSRSDWGVNPVFVSVCFNNLLTATHLTFPPGQVQIQRGSDSLLVNAAGATEAQSFQFKSTYGNTLVVDDNGNGMQTYRWAMGTWFGSPGVVVQEQESKAEYDYISGDFKAAYSHNQKPGAGGSVPELTRQVVYLRPNWVVVYDRVTTVKEGYPKQQRWHTLNAPTVDGHKFSICQNQSKLFGEAFSSNTLSLTNSRTLVGNKPIYQILIQNANALKSVTYLTVFEVTSSAKLAMDPARFSTSSDGNWDEIYIGTAKLAFSKMGTGLKFQFSSQAQ